MTNGASDHDGSRSRAVVICLAAVIGYLNAKLLRFPRPSA